MKIIVDTCIWSLALRRHTVSSHSTTNELQKLIEDSRVQMIGPIRQELLSGIQSVSQFTKLKTYLSAFPDYTITTTDHELAAEYFNACRAKGIQGSGIDFLICAMAYRNKFPIFTTDNDFKLYARVIPVSFYD